MGTHLVLSDLHVSYQVVAQVRQDGRQEPLKASALAQSRDELKDGKGGALVAQDLPVTVTHAVFWLPAVHYRLHVTGWVKGPDQTELRYERLHLR